jgi:hypothetical protein
MVPVTSDNVGSILPLAEELCLQDLISECSTLQMNLGPEPVAQLERQTALIPELKEILANYGRQLEGIVSSLIKKCAELTQKTCELQGPESLDGIIAHLTQKHSGNVHDTGIVTITSKSVRSNDPEVAPRNIADLTAQSCFISKDEPGQWVCWDFHGIRVRLTHIALRREGLKSWVIDSSLDGENWTEIDRQTNSQNSKGEENPYISSFAVSKSIECCFIRLGHTGENHYGGNILALWAFEVFGTLFQ